MTTSNANNQATKFFKSVKEATLKLPNCFYNLDSCNAKVKDK